MWFSISLMSQILRVLYPHEDFIRFRNYSLRPKLYDVLSISHVLRNIINFVWEINIISCFTKLSLINGMRKIN